MKNSATYQAAFAIIPFKYGDVQLKEAGYIGITPYLSVLLLDSWGNHIGGGGQIQRLKTK